jgi:hypothetical protein
MHYAVASIDKSGAPRVTPIGSVMLTTPGRGVFFQRFTTGLPQRVEYCDSIAILGVNSGRSFWFRSLFAGRFAAPPGLRLNAKVVGGPRRPTADEIARFRKRVRVFKSLRGYGLLWRDPGMARDFEVVSVEPIKLGEMTRGHWANLVAEPSIARLPWR